MPKVLEVQGEETVAEEVYINGELVAIPEEDANDAEDDQKG